MQIAIVARAIRASGYAVDIIPQTAADASAVRDARRVDDVVVGVGRYLATGLYGDFAGCCRRGGDEGGGKSEELHGGGEESRG